ncbi:hypothetical protein HPP92_012219 [Vanilla planifolia]|uniref:Uncharacterized protein n=1 Tax=Vanilla planifolia TaxID=51239 RepID=A0A835V564_VANPL|nr:hypothetical protein HPP92_012219 [Vanilla planifolia]
MISNIKHYVDRSEMDERKVSRPASHSSEEIEYGPGGAREERNLFVTDEDGEHSTKKAGHDYLGDRECKEMMRKSSDGHNKTNAVRGRSKDVEYREIIRGEGEHGKRSQSSCSDSEEFENIVKRRHKRSEKSEKDVKVSSDTDSQVEGRKEAKRRRKEEKRMRREERRRRREERHRKRLERHAAKHKGKATDNASPLSGFEKQNVEVGNSEGNADDARRSSHSKDVEDGVSEQKRLEIELRNKALESLRAKKAIG